MIIYQNTSLKAYNTFGIDAKASEFVEVKTVEEVQALCSNFNLTDRNVLVLGGGSNILLTGDFNGMVIRMAVTGIDIVAEDNEHVWIRAMAGEVWHNLVMYCVDHGYGGIENLSLIPGCVGAAPMQNIGAYGVELKSVFENLSAVEIADGNLVEFQRDECRFGYRESIFKHEAKGKYIIVAVVLKLSKHPVLNTSYGAVQQTLEKHHVTHPGIKDVSDAVIEIRRSKLPDPAVLGNAGSFFKNPEIDPAQFEKLRSDHPAIPGYPTSQGKVKLAAGWLIEQCGWKGKVVGHTGSHKDQALVLVNYGGATGGEILSLAQNIRQSVAEKFGVDIQPEVNIV
jgi:UDP-N-acetylmuramate dehydrogenase